LPPRFLSGTLANVDPRRRAEIALFEHVPLPVAIIDSERHIVEANPAFVRTFGEPENRSCHEVYKGESARCESCPLVPLFSDIEHAPEIFEEQGVTDIGRVLTYQLKAVPICGENGQSLVLAISADVTAHRELQRELNQAERLANVGLTVASLAHTIKNILSGLEGGIYLVGSGLERDDRERVKGGWSMVQRYVAQVTSLVKNLLNYARSREPERKLVEPGSFLQEVVRFFDEEARRAGIELVVEVAPGTDNILLDPDLLHSCLANLVANALDACTWDPDLDKPHRIAVTALPRPGGGVIFEVRDNGMGIPEENQPKIMASLFTTKGIRGTGLGLLLSRKAVQEHGGTITFESTPGEGAVFRVALPTSPKPKAAAHEGHSSWS
jgi:signal transduction histidine kinase